MIKIKIQNYEKETSRISKNKNMDEERMVKKVTQEAEKLGQRIYLQKQKE